MELEEGMVMPNLAVFQQMARAMVEQGGRFQAGDMRLFSRADGSISYTVICADFDDTECNSGASVADWENGQFIVEGIEPEHSEDCIALQEQRRQQRLHQQQLLMQLPSPGPTEDRPDPPTPPRASLQAEERRASSIPITNPAPAQSLPLPLPQRSQAQAVTHFPEGSTKSNQQIFDWRKNVAASSHSNGSPSWCGSQDEVVAPRDDDKVQIRDIQDASPTVQDKQAAISGQPRTPGSHAPLTLHEESTETRRISSEQRETSSTAHLPATSSSLHRKDHICVGNEYSTLLELEEHVMAWHEQKYPHRTPSQGVTRCSTLKTARTSLLCKLRRKQIASCPLRIAFRCKAGDVYWISEAILDHSEECNAAASNTTNHGSELLQDTGALVKASSRGAGKASTPEDGTDLKAEKYKTTPALPGSNDALSKSNNPVENGIGVNTSPPGASALSSGPSRQFSDSQPPKQASSIGTGDVDLTEKDATTLRVQSISHPQTGLSREGSSRPMARRGRGRPRGSTKRKSEIRAPAPDYTKLAGSTSMRAAVKASLLEAAGQHSTTSAADRTHLSASASRKIVSETETSLEGDSSSESSGDYETSLDPGNPFRVGTRFDNYVAIQTALAVWNDQNCPGHIVKRYYLRQESRTNKPNVRCSLQQKKHVDCDFRIVFHPSERDDESYVVDQSHAFHSKECDVWMLKTVSGMPKSGTTSSRSSSTSSARAKSTSQRNASGQSTEFSPRKKLLKTLAGRKILSNPLRRNKVKASGSARLAKASESDNSENNDNDSNESDSYESDGVSQSEESSEASSDDRSSESSGEDHIEGEESEDTSSEHSRNAHSLTSATTTSAVARNNRAKKPKAPDSGDSSSGSEAEAGITAPKSKQSSRLDMPAIQTAEDREDVMHVDTSVCLDTIKAESVTPGPAGAHKAKGEKEDSAKEGTVVPPLEEELAQLKKPFRDFWPKQLVDRLELHSLYCLQDFLDAGIEDEDIDEIRELVMNEEPFEGGHKDRITKVQLYMAKKHITRYFRELNA